MIRLAATLLASLALAAPARAAPPVPEVAVLVLAPWGGPADFAELMLARVAPTDGSGLLLRTAPAFRAEDFQGCWTGEPETCVRGVLTARGAAALDGPPTVIVLLTPGPGFVTGWTCIGVGEAPTRPERQRVGLDGRSDQAEASARTAAGCLLAAAAESGW